MKKFSRDVMNKDSDVTTSLGISGFGFKNIWFAVKSTDPIQVAYALGITSPQEIGWHEGVEAAYQTSVFITPPIDGWILAVGWGLWTNGATDDVQMELTRRMSEEFGEAQFFGTHRITEAHCWIKAVAGKVVRAYSYVGEQGENLIVEGEPTEVERNWNLFNSFSDEAKNDDYWERTICPGEDHVMKVAAAWSIDPSELSARENIPERGLLGIPSQVNALPVFPGKMMGPMTTLRRLGSYMKKIFFRSFPE